MADSGSVPAGFEYRTVKSRTRRVMAWLILIFFGLAVMWFAIGKAVVNDYQKKDAQCEEVNRLVADDWSELCGDALGDTIRSGIAYLLAFEGIILTLVFLAVWITRPKSNTRLVPISQIKPNGENPT